MGATVELSFWLCEQQFDRFPLAELEKFTREEDSLADRFFDQPSLKLVEALGEDDPYDEREEVSQTIDELQLAEATLRCATPKSHHPCGLRIFRREFLIAFGKLGTYLTQLADLLVHLRL